MKHFSLLIIAFFVVQLVTGQQFITQGTIEYEVKANVKKTMGNDSWDEMMKENMSDFKIGYYTYSFKDDKSVYKFSRWNETIKIPKWWKESDEEDVWSYDFKNSKGIRVRNINGTKFYIADSFPQINWKISNESREIAGFNCRKATGIIFDSVFVFAFYTDEITIPGGPCSISGLPGTILGLTIPRMYTSYIATKVSVANITDASIEAPDTKKPYTNTNFKLFIEEKTKEWFSWGDDEEENKKQKAQFLWGIYL